jgi:hypothetical protein
VATGSATVATRIETKARTTNSFKTFVSRYFYLCMSLVIAANIVAGFSKTVNANLFHATPPRPVLLWMHGTAFAGWLVLFMAQSVLVRVRKVSVHRLLGWFGAGLAATMVVLGCTVTVVMTRFDLTVLHQKTAAAFIAIPFGDMLIFGTCMALAIYWRKRPDFHRRLVFVATCELMDAGIGRFAFIYDNNLFYVCVDLLIVLGMARDWYVDGRIHKVYLYALPAMAVIQAVTIYAWRADPPVYQAFTHAVLGM